MSDIIKFPIHGPTAAEPGKNKAAERGVTEATVRRCIANIEQNQLDLKSCIAKGGSWAVAARRILAVECAMGLKATAQSLMANVCPEFRDSVPEIFHKLGGLEPRLSITQQPTSETTDD